MIQPDFEQLRCQIFLFADIQMHLSQIIVISAGIKERLRPKSDQNGQMFLQIDFYHIGKDVAYICICKQFFIESIYEEIEVVAVFNVFHEIFKKKPFLRNALKGFCLSEYKILVFHICLNWSTGTD